MPRRLTRGVSAAQLRCKHDPRRCGASEPPSRKETTVPLHNTTATAVRMPRCGRLAAIAAAAATAGAVTIAVIEDRPAPQVRTIEAVQPAASRYFDIEANK